VSAHRPIGGDGTDEPDVGGVEVDRHRLGQRVGAGRWCWAKGGDWRRRIGPVVDVREV